MQIHIVGFCFSIFFPPTFSLYPFKVLQQFSHTTHWLVYDRLCGLISSCHGDASVAADHGYSYFSPLLFFFLHCLADHLLLQLTCEWS